MESFSFTITADAEVIRAADIEAAKAEEVEAEA